MCSEDSTGRGKLVLLECGEGGQAVEGLGLQQCLPAADYRAPLGFEGVQLGRHFTVLCLSFLSQKWR
jgi:hypothetical protein